MANTKVTSAVIESGAILSTHIASGAITSGHLSGINTAAVAEGTNLYYTDTRARASISVTGGNLSYDNSTGVLQLTDSEIRDALSATSSGDGSLTYTAGTGVIAYTGPSASEVRAHLSAGTGVTYSGGQISIGQAVGTSDTVSFGNITTTGYLRGPANFTIDPAAYGDDTGTLIIAGNLQVDGTTTTINSTTLTVDDLNLTLASGAANAAAANGAGITVDGASATLLYAASGDKFVFNKGLDVTGNIGVTGTVDGIDIAARDAVLTSTTTTAGAALPKAGGTMTGNLQIYKAEPIITLQRSNNALLSGLSWQGSGGAEAASIKLDGTSGATNTLIMSTYNGSTMAERLRLMTNAAGGIAVTGTISVTGTVDGVDIAARDAVLTSTTTTANAALPVSGGNMTGNIQLNNNIELRTLDTGGNARTIVRANSSNELEYGWSANAPVKFMGGGSYTERMRIHTNGNIGIGTGSTSPTATLDVAGTALVENAKLKAIAESNSDTAVDVFVYDTRKDSDGGAWRKRTQHTSWYNETLNTSTRGARKEFPSVAVIVAEAYQLTIYDGDDPDMPMWMVFNGQAAGGYLGYGIGAGRSLSSVVALNGAIHNGGLVGNWATDINFITERGYFWGKLILVIPIQRL